MVELNKTLGLEVEEGALYSVHGRVGKSADTSPTCLLYTSDAADE